MINLRFPSKKAGLAALVDPSSPTGETGNIDPQTGQINSTTASDVGLPEAFAFIKRSEFRLSGIRSRLTKSSKFEPLLHLGWRQPTALPKKALPVYLYYGIDNPSHRSALEAPLTNSKGAQSGIGFASNQPVGPKNSRLYGVVTLSVSRYLHLKSDLHFRAPVLQQEYVLEPPNSGFFESNAEPIERLIERDVLLDFTMAESRRMRSKEIHYFDHPMFGLIVLVTPVDVTGDS